MSIKLLAQELYRLIREVERLEREFDKTPFDKRAEIEDKLRKARAEKKRVHGMLEGRKDSPTYTTKKLGW